MTFGTAKLTHVKQVHVMCKAHSSRGVWGHAPQNIFNPRRACAARVTVVSVCLSVCLSMTILALQATRRLMSDTNSFSATRA